MNLVFIKIIMQKYLFSQKAITYKYIGYIYMFSPLCAPSYDLLDNNSLDFIHIPFTQNKKTQMYLITQFHKENKSKSYH